MGLAVPTRYATTGDQKKPYDVSINQYKSYIELEVGFGEPLVSNEHTTDT